ncbi:MAG TPA: ankyrin repeat domain-containing protein [Puia sp.]|nr:ankyrin repeat domain-containing protein [Puia sp.]
MKIGTLPVTAGIVEYRRQAEELYAGYLAGDSAIKSLVHSLHPRLRRWLGPGEYPYAPMTFADIKLTMAEWYYLESWAHLEAWVEEASSSGSRVSSFEAAAVAILSGDTSGLHALMRLYPSLIRHRSMRRHHGTLLHYIAANGIEFRDHYPDNMPEILEVLLGAGAEVNAQAAMYGGCDTTLGLVATSIHPAKAGVMKGLVDRLLAAGALIDAPDAMDKRQLTVNACLANGRPEAASYLAQLGAHLDLEGAAGVGRLDVVEGFFDAVGKLKKPHTHMQLSAALNWASEYGHPAVVGYLMDRGADPDEPVNGMYALHMAILGGHLDTIRLLIERGAPLETQNQYGGTPLTTAIWAVKKRERVHIWPEKKVDNLALIETLIAAGALASQGFLSGVLWMPRSKLKQEIEAMLVRYGIEPIK